MCIRDRDNCKTAVVHNGGFKDQQVNETYQEMAEYYGTAIIPARVRAPKDKPKMCIRDRLVDLHDRFQIKKQILLLIVKNKILTLL